MTVAHGQSIFVPYVCAVYTCKCGRRAVHQGGRAGVLPRGWATMRHGEHACDACRRKSSRSAT